MVKLNCSSVRAVVHHLQVDGFLLTPVLVGAGIGHTVIFDQKSGYNSSQNRSFARRRNHHRDTADLQTHLNIG